MPQKFAEEQGVLIPVACRIVHRQPRAQSLEPVLPYLGGGDGMKAESPVHFIHQQWYAVHGTWDIRHGTWDMELCIPVRFQTHCPAHAVMDRLGGL